MTDPRRTLPPDPALEDLCRPLSAKVQPARRAYSLTGRELSDQEVARLAQREINRRTGRPMR